MKTVLAAGVLALVAIMAFFYDARPPSETTMFPTASDRMNSLKLTPNMITTAQITNESIADAFR